MKNFEFNRNGDVGILTFYGELVLKRADEMKEAFLIALANADRVLVNFKEVIKVEPACLQLICFAHRISQKLNKRITLIGTDTGIFKKAVLDAGYGMHGSCIMI